MYDEGLKDPFVPVNEAEPMVKSWGSADENDIGWAVAMAAGSPGWPVWSMSMCGDGATVEVEIPGRGSWSSEAVW